MKRELMAILACPQCKGGLELDVESDGQAYMIVEGIPDLRPPEDG
jgi:uncharacterized protein YbaR (Trm112 family)